MILLCSQNNKLREHWLKGLVGEDEPVALLDNTDQLGSKLNGSSGVLVLLDVDNAGSETASWVTSLLSLHPAINIFALSSKPNPGQGIALVQVGVRGYGNCWMHPETLCQSSRLIRSGEVWLGQEIIQHLIKGIVVGNENASIPPVVIDPRLADLTARELEITERVATGESNKLIAYELGITERTVKAHMSNIFQKTAAKDRLQLALLVNNQGH
jgi:two-component system nitrate/nitrite response regulator NarL